MREKFIKKLHGNGILYRMSEMGKMGKMSETFIKKLQKIIYYCREAILR